MTDRVLVVTPAAVLDAVGRAIIASDLDGLIVSWNRGAERLDGWRAEEVLGQNILDVLVPEPLHDQAEAIMARLRSGQPWAGDFWTRHRDGHTLRVAVANRALLDDAGEVVGIVGE